MQQTLKLMFFFPYCKTGYKNTSKKERLFHLMKEISLLSNTHQLNTLVQSTSKRTERKKNVRLFLPKSSLVSPLRLKHLCV